MSIQGMSYGFQAPHNYSAMPSRGASSMTFALAMKNYFVKAFDFKGTASRKEFWIPWLVFLPLVIAEAFFEEWEAFWNEFTIYATPLFFTILFFPFFSLIIRRFRDTAASTLAVLIPLLLGVLRVALSIVGPFVTDSQYYDFTFVDISQLSIRQVLWFTFSLIYPDFYGIYWRSLDFSFSVNFYDLVFVVVLFANAILLIYMALPSRQKSIYASSNGGMMYGANPVSPNPMNMVSYGAGMPQNYIPAYSHSVPIFEDPVLQELDNPALSQSRLQEIAALSQTHPEYRAKILAHPNTYPALCDWIWSLP